LKDNWVAVMFRWILSAISYHPLPSSFSPVTHSFLFWQKAKWIEKYKIAVDTITMLLSHSSFFYVFVTTYNTNHKSLLWTHKFLKKSLFRAMDHIIIRSCLIILLISTFKQGQLCVYDCGIGLAPVLRLLLIESIFFSSFSFLESYANNNTWSFISAQPTQTTVLSHDWQHVVLVDILSSLP